MNIKQLVQHVVEWLRRVVSQPRSELNRWQLAVRFAHDLGRYGARQLRKDRAPQMAAALAYRTLFGLLPSLVVGTAIVRSYKGTDEFLGLLRSGLEATGLNDIVIASEVTGGVESNIIEWVMPLMQMAAESNLTAIGAVGLAVLIYAAISFMVTIENSFNGVYNAPEGRPWLRRITMYWFVLSVGPIVLGLAGYVSAQFDDWVGALGAWQWMLAMIGIVTPFLTVMLFIFATYMMVPNTNVEARPALIGAFVATLLIEIGNQFIGVYISNAVSFTQFYGSLGFIPIFMFSVYVMWLIILFGLEVSVTLQMLPGHTLAELKNRQRSRSGLVDPAAVLAVMHRIAQRFREGHPTSARVVAETTSLPEPTILTLLEHLSQQGFIHRLDDGTRGYALARPPEQIDASALMDVAFELADDAATPTKDTGLIGRMRDAQRQVASEATLASMLT